MTAMPGFCRDCMSEAKGQGIRCAACGSPRMVRHAELDALAVAHVDCDAFFAAVEKRDDPSLRDKAVIVGGGRRGVVSTCCYIARINGVRSAMPMFKALKLCPQAIVVKPNHAKYSVVGREVKTMMRALTPLVESVSIDEAFLDLSGTERVHGMSPARVLARFAKRVEDEIGITVSVGLSANKFLAKIASDLDKPRGFACIGPADAISFLDEKPVRILPGIGAASAASLEKEGIRLVGDIRRADMRDFVRRHGAYGLHLWQLAHGEDKRPVRSERETKSVSSETTFNEDISDATELTAILWSLSERVSARLKAAEFSGSRVTLKLKTSDFEARGERFRLIGIGVEELHPISDADPPDLLDAGLKRRIAAEEAMDRIRGKFGKDAVGKGIGFGRKG
jgi:DNA polymerase-4